MNNDDTSLYSIEFLQAVNDWQIGGDSNMKKKRGDALSELVKDKYEKFKTTDRECYRRIVLTKKYVWKLGENLELEESISAWTFSSNVAKSFKGGPTREERIAVIFKIKPPTECIIINLDLLYKNSDFLKAIESNKHKIKNFNKGIGKYKNSQNEIILKIGNISINSIYAFGGFSSSLTDLSEKYFMHEPNRKEKRFIHKRGRFSNRASIPFWITSDAKERTIEFLTSKTEEIKVRQNKLLTIKNN